MTQTPIHPIIRTQADLEQTWRRLMGPLGFSHHSIWLMLIRADDQPMPQLTQIEDAHEPPPPGDPHLDGLADILRSIAAESPGSRWAFLRSRPGTTRITDDDRGWAEVLHDVCRSAGVRCDVVHLATDDDLVPLPLDELGPRLAAVG